MKAKETAAIFIEFQNEFCASTGKLHAGIASELTRLNTLENAQRLLKGVREKGVTVIHCPFQFDADWVGKQNVCGLIAGAGQLQAFQPGSWGVRFYETMLPQSGETVLQGKHALSAFTNTGLNELLQENKIRNLICCGFLSNVCVEATARSAYDLGYRVQVAHDACASTSQSNQEYVEREIYPLLGGSKTVSELLAQLTT